MGEFSCHCFEMAILKWQIFRYTAILSKETKTIGLILKVMWIRNENFVKTLVNIAKFGIM